MNASLLMSPARPDRLIMATVFACSILAGWVMLPGDNERVAMLERDGHSREALAILEQEVTAGDMSYRTLHQILALYESEGEVAKARSVLEAMSAERPRDPLLKRRLAQFYRNSGNEAEYVAALQGLIEIHYSEPVCRELIAHLRFRGDAPAEQAALQRCRQKGYRRPEDLSRLAELVAADGDIGQAAGLLKSIDDLKRLKTMRERFQLLSLLAEQDQPKEAERRTLKWIRSAHDDATSVSFIDHLARSKYPDTAYEVAKDAGIPGDGISLTVAERLIEKTQNKAALLYLHGWLERATTVDPETAVRFLDAALAVADPRLAVQGARQFGYVLLPQQTMMKMADALDEAGASAEASDVRIAITSGAPIVPEGASMDVAKTAGNDQSQTSSSLVKSSVPAIPRIRNVLLVDPLDNWRRSLFTAMSIDAQRRMQALFVGPKPPSLHSERNFDWRGPGREQRMERHGGGAKFLNKTSRVLQRTKRLKALRAKHRAAGQTQITKPAVGSQSVGNPDGNYKGRGAQKP